MARLPPLVPTRGDAPHVADGSVQSGDALLRAAKRGDLSELANLLDHCAVDPRYHDESGGSALHYAALRNNGALIDCLVQRGLPVDFASSSSETPLMWAAKGGHATAIVRLVDLGAGLEVRNQFGMTAIHYAVAFNHTLVVALLAHLGALVDSPDKDHRTPLHWSAHQGAREMVAFLLTLGADRSLRDIQGDCALVAAAKQGHATTAAVLVQSSADWTSVRAASNETVAELLDGCAKRTARLEHQSGRAAWSLAWRWLAPSQQKWLVHGTVVTVVLVFALLFSYLSFMLAGVGFALFCGTLRQLLAPYWPPRTERVGELVTFFASFYALSVWRYFTLLWSPSVAASPEHLCFAAMNLALIALYTRLVRSSPGQITASSTDRDYLLASARSGAPLLDMCHTCVARRPLRSKHSRELGVCVPRFDHFCPWINNVVGLENHPLFVLVNGLVVVAHAGFIVFSLFALIDAPDAVALAPALSFIYWAYSSQSLLCAMAAFHLLNFCWLSMLFAGHLRNMLLANVTTNEGMNWNRYDHFKGVNGEMSNPFMGTCADNTRDFFQLGARRRNYYAIYSLRDLERPHFTSV